MIVAGMDLLPMILAVAEFAVADRPCSLNGFRRDYHISLTYFSLRFCTAILHASFTPSAPM